MSHIDSLMTDHLDLWTAAVRPKSSAGRGSNSKLELSGIKKLRELILELAVRGKLVPQDPNDEPASVLLERIAAEKVRLVKVGKIKKPKALPEIGEDEKPFELPEGWGWATLGSLGVITSSSRVNKKDWVTAGVPFFRTREIVQLSKFGMCDNELFISERLYDELIASGTVPEKDDVMLTGVGTIGVPYVVRGHDKFYFKDASVLIFKNIFNLWSNYFDLFFRSPCWVEQIHDGSMGTTVHTLTIVRANVIKIPIPPPEEQHRIVAKVDELMALCDQLEQQSEAQLAAQQTLVEVLLATLVDSADAGELAQNWARLAGHFDTLFTTEASIDALKQTILQLAVMGKLVPQDPSDEPAAVLLERIAAEREFLIKEGKIKKEKTLSAIADSEIPFEPPAGWSLVRLNDIIKISSGDGLTSKNMTADGSIPVYGGNGIAGYHDQSNVNKKTLVIGRVGFYCGSVHITPNVAWVTDNAFVTSFSELNICLEFLFWLLKATDLNENDNATAQPVISGRKIYPIVVCLPPLVEQQLITEKINELFSFCDQLKTRLQASQQTQLALAETLVEQGLGS